MIKARPAIIVLFVLYEDSALFFVPQDIVVVRYLTGVDAHKTAVDISLMQCLNNFPAVIITTDIRNETAV